MHALSPTQPPQAPAIICDDIHIHKHFRLRFRPFFSPFLIIFPHMIFLSAQAHTRKERPATNTHGRDFLIHFN